MKISIGTDHGAIEYKAEMIKHLSDLGHEVDDCGTNSTDSCDYPDYALPVAEKVAAGISDFGILMCGTGIGMSLAANKVKGIRAAVVPNVDYAKLAKQHNHANVICLSGRFMSLDDCKNCVDAYMAAKEEGDRHDRRVQKIMDIEKDYFKQEILWLRDQVETNIS